MRPSNPKKTKANGNQPSQSSKESRPKPASRPGLRIVLSQVAIVGAIAWSTVNPATAKADTIEDHKVYSVETALNMGEPNEAPKRDFYLTIGARQGIKNGSRLEAMRKTSSYDLLTKQLYRDLVFPIAILRVIHVEANASIARLETMLPEENAPVIIPRAVMVGDLVRIRRR